VVLQLNAIVDVANAPVPNEPFSVVVAVSPPERFALVPQAKPRTVGFGEPMDVMLPLRVAVLEVTDVASWVVTVATAGETSVADQSSNQLALALSEK